MVCYLNSDLNTGQKAMNLQTKYISNGPHICMALTLVSSSCHDLNTRHIYFVFIIMT